MIRDMTNFTSGLPREEKWYDVIREPLNDLQSMGVPFVVAAGNTGLKVVGNAPSTETLSDVLPGCLGTDDNNIITVGGVNSDGSLWTSSTPQGPNVWRWDWAGQTREPGSITVYGQASQVKAPISGSNDKYLMMDGTSFAAPAVVSILVRVCRHRQLTSQQAGLIAYFGTLQQSGPSQFTYQNAKDLIRNYAYPRVAADRIVPENDWSQLPAAIKLTDPPKVAYNRAPEG